VDGISRGDVAVAVFRILPYALKQAGGSLGSVDTN